MKKELFIESSPFLTRMVIPDDLKESIQIKQSNNNTLIVKNVPATILNRGNQNGRIYSTDEMQKAIDAAKQQIETKQLLCQASEHPEGSFVSPTHASHVITNAYIKPNVKLEVEGEKGTWDVLFCDIEVLNTQEGQNLQALLLSGCSVGTSIRGLGDMQGDKVINYEFLGFDVVSNPSSGTFTNMPIYEAKVESVDERKLDEATRYTISTYASNTTHDLQQAIDFQNNAATNLQYGTITNVGTKMDQEVDPDTGVEKIVGEVEVETSDDTSELKTAIDAAVKAFTNPNNINVTSVTIEKVDDDDIKDSVEATEEALHEEESDSIEALESQEMGEEVLDEDPLWAHLAKAKDWFAKNDREYNSIKPETVWKAIDDNKYNFLKSCVDHGVDLKHMQVGGQNPMAYAAAKGMVKSVEALAEVKGLVNRMDKNGSTPIMYAVSYAPNADDVVEVLLNNGADTSIKNKYNKTVFDYAKNKPEVLQVLQQNQNVNNNDDPMGIDAEEQPETQAQAQNNDNANNNQDQVNPAASVQDVAKARLSMLKSLLASNPIHVNAENQDGYNLYDLATVSGDQEMADVLKSLGAVHSNKYNIAEPKQTKTVKGKAAEESVNEEVEVTQDKDTVTITDDEGNTYSNTLDNENQAKAAAIAVKSDKGDVEIKDSVEVEEDIDINNLSDEELAQMKDFAINALDNKDNRLAMALLKAINQKQSKAAQNVEQEPEVDNKAFQVDADTSDANSKHVAQSQINVDNAVKLDSTDTKEVLHTEPDEPSDDIVEPEKQPMSDNVVIELTELSYDVDQNSDVLEDSTEEYESVLEALESLPETITITINAAELSPDSDPLDAILKQANAQTGLPIKNAKIANIKDAEED